MFLNCHSYYSLRYGTISVERLVAMARESGAASLALTDINNTTATADFISECRRAGIRPVAGVDFRNNNAPLYIGIARNSEGFRELNELLTRHNRGNVPLPFPAPPLSECYIIYRMDRIPERRLFDNEFIGVSCHETWKIHRLKSDNIYRRMVILHTVTLAEPNDLPVHKQLRAIDNNCLSDRISIESCAGKSHIFIPERELARRFSDFPEIADNTRRLIDDCTADLEAGKPKNRESYSGGKYEDRLLLEKLAWEGLLHRYGKDERAASRVRSELQIIDKLGFSSYFLITWDMIRFSTSKGFHHVGRGSGANSIVAYCLGITNVDPINLNLYFERFINPSRSSPPDFDIDYSWRDREEVIKYLFSKYGDDKTALLGTINRFRAGSAIRELSRTHGLPGQEVTALARESESPCSITREILLASSKIDAFPNIRSIHAGGVVISERPLTYYTALDVSSGGFGVTQWDMYTAEKLGYDKLDVLSQRGIADINDALSSIGERYGVRPAIESDTMIRENSLVMERLSRGETIGCFYIESPAMRSLLSKLKCSDYHTLVAASSIIRPGVSRSGMMREYIRRHNNPDKVSYPHPVIKEQLKDTFGIMVYQEDVLRVCHYFAGLGMADGDTLRRAMSGKKHSKEEIAGISERFFSGCRERGYSNRLAKEVWRQIESFAGYSFSKAHSASYAVESLQGLYLKSHYPLEFMVAVINNSGGFYPAWVYFHEARRQGGTIHLPCINKSCLNTVLLNKSDIYIGFIHISGIEKKMVSEIERERERGGWFGNLTDFMERCDAGLDQAIILIRSGAFRFTGKSKANLLWEAHIAARVIKKGRRTGGLSPMLFREDAGVHDAIPTLRGSRIEDAYDEIELLGFPVSASWFDLTERTDHEDWYGTVPAGHNNNRVTATGLLISVKRIRNVRGEPLCFGCFINSSGGYFDTLHFSSSLKKYPVGAGGVYSLSGTTRREFGHLSMVVEKAVRLPLKKRPAVS